jgi:hypothetical protein
MSSFNARQSGLVAAASALLLMSSLGSTAYAAAPAAKFTAFERAALPAVSGPAAKSLPRQVQRFGKSPIGLRWGANPSEARAVTAPDGHQTWYVVPARRGICLVQLGTGGCQPPALVLKGNLYLQLVQPSSDSPASPLAPGAPVISRVVGLAPYGTTGVTAQTKTGTAITGVLKNGVFAISGADMTSFTLTRPPLVGPLFSG